MRNVLVLAIAQFFGAFGQVVTVLLAGILGGLLAPDPKLATVPLTTATLGIAAATIPAGLLMRRFGRKRVFIGAAFWPAFGTLLAAIAIHRHDFVLFCAATAIMGSQLAFIAQYRFAAAESVEPHRVPRAVSWIMLGTVIAALVAPWLVIAVRNVTATEYEGSYLVLGAIYCLGALVLVRYRDVMPPASADTRPARPLGELARQPDFRIAVAAAAVSYGAMSLIMTATPLSMHLLDGHSVEDTAWVLQSHVLAMYVPSLVSGLLLERLGIQRMMLLGVFAEGSCVAFASAGHAVVHYWAGLAALGVGWNLLFVAGTTLLTRTYRPAERYRVQSFNDFLMFGVMGGVSMAAGVLVNTVGWVRLNQLALIPLAGLALILLMHRLHRRQNAPPPLAS